MVLHTALYLGTPNFTWEISNPNSKPNSLNLERKYCDSKGKKSKAKVRVLTNVSIALKYLQKRYVKLNAQNLDGKTNIRKVNQSGFSAQPLTNVLKVGKNFLRCMTRSREKIAIYNSINNRSVIHLTTQMIHHVNALYLPKGRYEYKLFVSFILVEKYFCNLLNWLECHLRFGLTSCFVPGNPKFHFGNKQSRRREN